MLDLLKNLRKNYPITIYFILLIIIIFFINKISKPFLEQSKFERRQIPEFIEKVYGKENFKEYKKVLKEQGMPLRYEKFVEFVEQERIGDFTIVSSMGNRCNKNDNSKCFLPNGGKDEIWLFGGSTVFGYGVKNNETISAYLENILNNEFDVINFGTAFYWSTQERILLSNLLTKYEKPSKVIIINGINEFAKFYKYDESAMSERIRDNINKSSKSQLIDYFYERIIRLNFVRLINEKLFKKENKEQTLINNDEIDQIVNLYLKNQKIVRGISKEFEINLIQVLQPAPIYEDSYTSSNIPEDFKWYSSKDLNYQKVKAGYKKYLNKISDDVLDLSKFKITEPMYIDGVHYSPQFNFKIAEKISKIILE